MRIFFTLFVSLIFFNVQAQSNYVATYLVNPAYNALELHSLPWDETRLYQYTRNNGPGYVVYTIDEVAFNALTPVVPPLCSEIRETPEVLDDGLLIVGTTSSGNELLYYDEVNSTVFDLNPGAGDSDPEIYRVEDRVFVVAFDGTTQQLFEFDVVTHAISEITNSIFPVQSVCAVWEGDVFYRLKNENQSSGLDEYHLMKATFNGSIYAHDTILSIAPPNDPNRAIDWRSPQIFQGNLHFMTTNVGLNGSTAASFPWGMININGSGQVTSSSLVLPNSDGEFFIVQWDGKLGVYSNLHDTFYSSSDGVNFQSNAVPVNGRLVESHVSENDQLYFTCLYTDETREIFEYDGGFQSKFLGEHLHFLSEHNDILYYSEYNQFDSSSVILVYSAMNVVDEVNVYFAFHPPVANASTMFNGYFTFLFGAENGLADENDILQLAGSPSASIDEEELEMSIYPNPINSGEPLTMRALRDGEVQLINTSGNILKSFDITNGETQISTASLSPGVYFISFMNRTERIVVK